MDLIERDYLIQLFETYQDLLTEKQKEYFTLYYLDDLSLAEIAENINVSRNAIFDQLKKVQANLEQYESALKLLEKKQKLDAFKEKLSDDLKEELEKII